MALRKKGSVDGSRGVDHSHQALLDAQFFISNTDQQCQQIVDRLSTLASKQSQVTQEIDLTFWKQSS